MKKAKFLGKGLFYIFFFVFFSVLYLVLEEPKESVCLTISISILLIIIKDKDKILSGIPFYYLTLVFTLSFFISTLIIFSRGYSMELTVEGTVKDIDGKAVLLVYEGEPEMYSFEKGITNIKINGSIKDKIISPYILWLNKRHYQFLGKSNYKENTIKVKKGLQTFLTNEFKVYVSYLYDTAYVEEVLIEIANDGYRDVIIVPVFLTEGQNLRILKSRIERMKLYSLNINVKYTDPLWNSEDIAISYENKIKQHIDDESVANIGIILVGEGQVGYRKNNNLKAVREDSMFRNRIKAKLGNNTGINENKIKIGWFKYVEPDYEESIIDLLDYSIRKIVLIYTKPSVTNIENITISKKIASKVNFPEGVKVTIVDGFLNDFLFINELKNRIEFTNLQKWE
ncbi:CbiX/SirB N-terminal domain-containing protein [Proteiniborus sp.]|uniref:CbiX/SirB N-terminal domain-containing protein n=1 Tax=Proteiniborus sp. TaxID=2079015 RepID=UPI0033313AA4